VSVMRLAAASATAAVAAAVAFYYYHRRRNGDLSFTVLSWNILAREFTMFNRKPPGCVQGHLNPDNELETESQTAARYSLAAEALIARKADAVLLQECSKSFFDALVNPLASSLLEHYAIAHATNEKGPGTVVLLLKAGSLTSTGEVFTSGGSEITGGTSKSASGVKVTPRGGDVEQNLWLVSLHLTPYKFKPQEVCKHLELLGDAIRSDMDVHTLGAPPRVVLGGDLNAEPDEVAAIQRECPGPLGSLLHRVVAPGNTGLSATFAEPCLIDHLFLSPGLRTCGSLELERLPESPYGLPAWEGETAPVAFASDHVWQSLKVAYV